MSLKTEGYDYFLPKQLIAQEPIFPRDDSRLMFINKLSKNINHHLFNQLPSLLQKGDLLVLNNTKVLPARLFGLKKDTGAKIELLLLTQLKENQWQALVKPAKRLKVNDVICFYDKKENLYSSQIAMNEMTEIQFGKSIVMVGKVIEKKDKGIVVIEFSLLTDLSFIDIINNIGEMPTPPYITKKLSIADNYQTIYASQLGAVAAPTAGLHFTKELFTDLKRVGVETTWVTLHVGLGTFKPVNVDNIKEHCMHSEWFNLSEEASVTIKKAKQEKRRVIAVGTTAVRVLESIGEDLKPQSGWTDIFIYPGYNFSVIDGLITNFHLPKSTLLMLVAAFIGRETILNTYQVAIENNYRFYSFGDAMLIM